MCGWCFLSFSLKRAAGMGLCMHKFMMGLGALGVLGLAGCGKGGGEAQLGVAVVGEGEQSGYFSAVQPHLELGGVLYGYADIDGDLVRLAEGLWEFAKMAAEEVPMMGMAMSVDVGGILRDLGADDIKAVGLSSVKGADGIFRNRVYLHTPEGRRGLLKVVGGGSVPFSTLHLAPRDADVFMESDYDLPSVYEGVRAVVARVGGEMVAGMLDGKMKEEQDGVSAFALMNSLKGRSTLVVRIPDGEAVTLPGGTDGVMPRVPMAEILFRIEGVAPELTAKLAQVPGLVVEKEGTRRVYSLEERLPIAWLDLRLEVVGNVVTLVSAPGLLVAPAVGDSLADEPEFKRMLGLLGAEGNGLTYVTPRFFEKIHLLGELNQGMPKEVRSGVQMILSQVPQPGKGLMMVRVNLPEGLLFTSLWHRSMKRDLVMLPLMNPAGVGLLAAMAIPAFQKVRASSQEKAIMNNLRQLGAASQQYFLETGKAVATYDDLVGTGRNKYIRSLDPVAGEDYTGLVFRQEDRVISVTTAAGVTVSYEIYRTW